MRHLRGSCGRSWRRSISKSIESRLQLKSKLYGFQMQRGCSINEYLNRHTKLLKDLVNVDVETSEENKAVILLNSLSREEYETFTLTLLNGRKSLNYSEVSAALVSYELRRQDRLSFREHNCRGICGKRQEFQ